MNKQEFVDRLRVALTGRIPAPQVEENVNYYMDYINTEIRKGRSEEEVLQALGDPRLIARTIIQTCGTADTGYRGENYDSRQTGRGVFRIPGWLLAIIVFLAVLLVVSLVFSVVSALAPFLIVMAAVIFLVKLFRDWLN